jgi:uncharacterized membrane protein YhhN
VLAFAMPIGGWFWRIPLGLAPGVVGDLLLALGGVRRFLAGVAALGLGHLAYAGELFWRAGELGLDELSGRNGRCFPCWWGWFRRPRSGFPPRDRRAAPTSAGLCRVDRADGCGGNLVAKAPEAGVPRLGAALFILLDLMLALQLFVVKGEAVRRMLALALWSAYWTGRALILWGAVTYAGMG